MLDEMIRKMVVYGLQTPGEKQKQWYLEQIADLLCIENLPDHEPGERE